MSPLYKAAGWGSVMALIALLIAFIKQAMAFLGFLTFAIKALIFFAFAALFLGVGYLVLRSFRENRDRKGKA